MSRLIIVTAPPPNEVLWNECMKHRRITMEAKLILETQKQYFQTRATRDIELLKKPIN